MFHFIYLKGTTQFNIDPIWSIAVANFQLLLSLVGLYIHKRLNYIKPLYTKMIKLQNLHMSKYLCPTSNVCRVHVSIGFVSVCVCVLTQACEGKFFCASVVSGDGGVSQQGTAISCVQVAIFELWLGGGVWTCRPCVWEPCAPHFSYIVLPFLQTVNATKDAQPIVARDSWGRGEANGAKAGEGREV